MPAPPPAELGATTAESSTPPPPRPAPLSPPGRGQAARVEGAEGLTRLCDVLRDESGVQFSGNAVEQARTYESHTQRRQAALAGRYVTVVPPGGFTFRNYDLGAHRLVLDTNRSLVLGEGAELFVPSQDQSAGFALRPELADRVLAQQAEGKISLQLLFRPSSSQLRKDACVWLGGGRVVKLEIELVAAALLGPDGAVLARADTGEYADASLGSPVRSPRVTVRKPRSGDGRDISPAVTQALGVLAHKAQPCYERVLIVRPDLRGTLVLGVRTTSGGRVDAAHVEMSSLGDDALTACVSASATKATISGAAAGQRFSVPLQFSSADD